VPVYATLDALGIPYEKFSHPPVFNAEDVAAHWSGIDATKVKNLFLRNKKGDRHYLVILEIGKKLGIPAEDLIPYGHTKAKLSLDFISGLAKKKDGKLILVTAINPTPAGEGKTTTTVGLGDGLNRIGRKAMICIREASLGPNFGMKGGAAGGGYAQIVPMEDVNLHFTGDFHAITSAHNLLSALIDNHIYWGNALNIDQRRVAWRRVLDMNDRALRSIVSSLFSMNATSPTFPKKGSAAWGVEVSIRWS